MQGAILNSSALFISAILLPLFLRRWKRQRRAKYKAVALDLDGTALTSHHTFSDRTKIILEKLSQNGTAISICTGRSISSLMPIIQNLRLDASVPVVCYNGSCVFVVSENYGRVEKVFSTPFDVKSAEEVLQFASQHGVCAQYYIEDTGDVFAVPTNDEHRALLQRYFQLVGRQQIFGSNYEAVLMRSRAAKILLMTNQPDELLAAARLRLNPDKFNLVRGSPDPFFIEVLPPNTSKGSGLVAMCKLLGYNTDEVVAFGDGDNDKEFLESAGLGVAMKNAKEIAKKSANIVLEVLLFFGVLMLM
jgi:Cof subfamily protein (haloacid dehalogenase superfamily)